MRSDFNKFPSTPHLATLPGVSVRADKVFDKKRQDEFLSHNITIEEKIDGANLGISFDEGGSIVLQNRGSRLTEPYSGQWQKLYSWLQVKTDLLFDVLGTDLIIFGEWCYAKHSVYYNSLPDWFIGFDILEKKTQVFWSSNKRNILLERIDVPPVPLLGNGRFTLNELENILSRSIFSSEPAEGLYLRYEDDEKLVERVKLVRPAFIQAVNEHWSKSHIQPNTIAGGGWV